MAKPVFLSWSSGKDSAWTLHTLQQDPDYEVVALVTTVNEKHKRVAMHGVREQILQQQADAVGLPPLVAGGSVPGRHSSISRKTTSKHRRKAGISALAKTDLSTGKRND